MNTIYKYQKINYLKSALILSFNCFLVSLSIFSELNTEEIQTDILFRSIDEYISEQKLPLLPKADDINSLLKKVEQLQQLIDYAENHKDNEIIPQAIRLIEILYEDALKKYPDNIRLYDYYGSFLYDYKMDYLNSVKLWEKAYEINPKDASINNNLALHYFHIGEYDKGWKYLQEALKYGDTEPNIQYNAAQIFIIYRNQIHERTGWDKQKIYKKAMDFSEKAVKLKPDDFELCKDYALNYFTAFQFGLPVDGKKSAQAWRIARKVARNNDEIFYTWLNEGRAWLSVKKLDNARQCLLEALKIKPDSEITKNILMQIESGEIKDYFNNEKKNTRNYGAEEHRNPFLSPLKNFTGRKKSKNPLQNRNIEATKQVNK